MMPINLISLRQAYEACKSEAPELFEKYLHNFKIKLEKKQEKEDIMKFIDIMGAAIGNHVKLNDFYLGYIIPQISKEFDLLRLGENYHLNIEIKHRSTFEDIQKQLRQNRYYLQALYPIVRIFSYIISTGEIYYIDERSTEIIKTTAHELIRIITEQKVATVKDLDELFSPKQYLVSPLNSTDKFMNQNYFLTIQQEEFKVKILKSFETQQLRCALISGPAGTGKTLLAYDIALHYMQQKQQVCLIHCGKLSEGHYNLRSKYGWDIFGIKDYDTALMKVKTGGLIVIDEAQRIFKSQIVDIFSKISTSKTKCIFSYDPKQFISNKESKAGFFDQLKIPYEQHPLSEKIRTNKEIASFIYNLFDKSKINTDPTFHYKNVYLQYFDNQESVLTFLNHLKQNEGWETLNYTESTYTSTSFSKYQNGSNKNAHDVIGQEFDKVAVVINEYFHYQNGQLVSYHHPAGYHMNQMLFQLITRTRDKLYIVIYNNLELLTMCLKILSRENLKTPKKLSSP